MDEYTVLCDAVTRAILGLDAPLEDWTAEVEDLAPPVGSAEWWAARDAAGPEAPAWAARP